MRRIFIATFTCPLFPALVAFVGALTGLWASMYSAEMKESATVLFSSAPLSGINNDARHGWSLFLSFFVLFALQQLAKNFQDSDANQAVLRESAKLKQLVERMETLPPDGFLQEYQELYREIAQLTFLPFDGRITKKGLEQAIRAVVQSIANLAHKFDGAGPGARYSANVMLCIERHQIDKLPPAQRAALAKRLMFCPDLPEPKIENIRAVLDLAPALSLGFEADVSTNTPFIALPVPEAHTFDLGPEHGERFKVLPGAPFVAARHQYAVFESPESLFQWCDKRADLTKATISEIRRYFHQGAGKDVKSFISIPICTVVGNDAPVSDTFGGLAMALNQGTNREECLAVLNIDSNCKKILGENGYELFVPIIEPFCQTLSLLLAAYAAEPWADEQEGATLENETSSSSCDSSIAT